MAISELVKNLQNEKIYPHKVTEFKVMETHVSWVILTGHYAYKIKKPVDFEFLNYTTLELRKHFCEQELRLNKRLAPELYLEVLPITGSVEKPELNGQGDVIEYILVMREFPQQNMYSNLLANNKLTLNHMQQVATILADFHQHASTNGPKELGTVIQVHEPVIQNFDQIRPLLKAKTDLDTLAELENWANQQHKHWHDLFVARKQNGFIRECHGDIHLGNITQIDDKPVLFDCIEFNEPFRWTDTMADLGFLVMDLHDHGQYEFANHVINTYLEQTGDYEGLQIFPYYAAYRAMVRAKVSLFELNFSQVTEQRAKQLTERYQHFIELAKDYANLGKPFLAITHGLSSSGKSTIAKSLSRVTGAIQIRSDVERKRLAGLKPNAKTGSRLNQDLYRSELTTQTYTRLQQLARFILNAGYSVIVDAAFLKQAQRKLFSDLATKHHVPWIILDCHAPLSQIEQWLKERAQSVGEASEATLEVLHMQKDTEEPLAQHEMQQTIKLDTTKKITPNSLKDLLNHQLQHTDEPVVTNE